MTDADTPSPVRFLDEQALRESLHWAILGISLLTGVIGAVSEGGLRRTMVALLLASFLAHVIILSRYPVIHRLRIDGIERTATPMDRVLRILNQSLGLLYYLSFALLIVAVLVRTNVWDRTFPIGIQHWAPLMFAGFQVIMVLAAKLHADAHGIHAPTWMSRVTAWSLAVVGIGTLGLAVARMAVGDLDIMGTVVTEVEVLGLMLLVTVLATTQVFLLIGLATPLDALQRLRERDDDNLDAAMPPIVYAIVATAALTAIVGVVASRLGIFSAVGDTLSNERGAYVLILLPAGLAAFAIYSTVRIAMERRPGLYSRRIPTKLRNDLLVYGWAGVSGLILATLTFRVMQGDATTVLGRPADSDLAKDLIALTILVTLGPIGVYLNRQARRIDQIESRLGDFLNDLAESRRAGLTLAAALHTTSRTDYGPLSKEVRKMSHQVAWGVPFTDALRRLQERVRSPLVERAANLIIEATRTGGSVSDLLKAAASDAREIKALERERRTTLSTYLIIIYVTFAVFMVVIGVMDGQFIPQVDAAQRSVLEAQSGGQDIGGFDLGARLDRDALSLTYYNAAMVQAVGNGVVAGILTQRRLSAGFRHVSIMVLLAWTVFRWVL